MKAEAILQELEAVKERLAAEANGDPRRFLDQMEAWLAEHRLRRVPEGFLKMPRL